MDDALKITRDGNQVGIEGFVNEDVDLTEAFSGEGPLTINLSEITRINSCGVREWMNAVRAVGTTEITFTECSVPIVEQFNMISDFSAHGAIQSFHAPYFCKACNKSVMKLLSVEEHGETCGDGQVPEFQCDSCQGSLEFDEDEDEFFMFLEND